MVAWPVRRCSAKGLLVAWVAALAGTGCEGINDRLMEVLAPNSGQAIEADFDDRYRPTIRSVVPAEVADGPDVEVDIRGRHFLSYEKPGPGRVWLARPKLEPVQGRITQMRQGRLTVRFDLSGVSAGRWDVHYRRLDGRATRAVGALDVRNGP